MRFFTSISIAALCFVASIQAAPIGALGAPALAPVSKVASGVIKGLPAGGFGSGTGATDTGATTGAGGHAGDLGAVTKTVGKIV
ncbi:predicted protein [Lichtheimia corymbifera JMRC:FSU:9682]|uniref:Uncharacterized protein n=1 Tax=Lichtheimia corymbifera JMRC:FSU:9682 TaxID=1263082 RepID=A0A068S8L1_9FUNG|nr:predicted protein [Lichtheimia corymbifera JMRC:FSU:9682]